MSTKGWRNARSMIAPVSASSTRSRSRPVAPHASENESREFLLTVSLFPALIRHWPDRRTPNLGQTCPQDSVILYFQAGKCNCWGTCLLQTDDLNTCRTFAPSEGAKVRR